MGEEMRKLIDRECETWCGGRRETEKKKNGASSWCKKKKKVKEMACTAAGFPPTPRSVEAVPRQSCPFER
jgi:hypothetical protein